MTLNGGVLKTRLMDGETMNRVLTRMAHEIIERAEPLDRVVLVGVRSRGVPLAGRLADVIEKYEGIRLPVWELDISRYRDDRSGPDEEAGTPVTRLPGDVTRRTVVLVDDVLYTGRTARAALDAVLDQGRPDRILLAVLVDRGHRELPIRPDIVGRNVPTSHTERVRVQVSELDGTDSVAICENP